MLYDKFKEKTKKWNHLAKVDTLGTFDFFSTIISLEALSKKNISDLRKTFNVSEATNFDSLENLTSDQYAQLAQIIPLATHEYTHFVDATSTIWGLRHLNLMNEAYLSDDRNGAKEENFVKAKRFYDHVRRIRLPEYYTVVDRSKSNHLPWESQITIGRLFSHEGSLSNRPVLFSRFINSKNEFLARSPISTVSLLESSAMAQEILSCSALINQTEHDFKLVEQACFSSRMLSHFYNPEITEYSVCVHVLANIQGCTEILSALRLCAALTRVSLNFPESAFERLTAVCPVCDILGLPEGHGNVRAIFDGIENEDLGVIFYLLCRALPKDSYESIGAIELGIEVAIKALGLDRETLQQEANDRAHELFLATSSSSISSIMNLAKAGYENFKLIKLDQSVLNFSQLSLPPVLLGDSTEMRVFPSQNNLLEGFSLGACFEELYRGQSWVERFSEACV